MSPSSRRKIAVFLLAAALSLPLPSAAEPRTGGTPRGSATAWELVAHLWNALTAAWIDAGCSVDPYGGCGASSSAPEPTEFVDEGCSVDPFGRCGGRSATSAPTENLDNGCSVDPFGGCGAGG